MSDIVKEYVKYVKETIDKFSKDSNLIYDDEVRPSELNRALGSFMNINLGLLGEYQRSKIESYELKKQYESWYDPKFSEICNRLNEVKGVSLKEKESELRNTYNIEYYDWQDKLQQAEYRERFLLRYIELYAKFDNILTCLSNNSRQEMRSLSLDYRMNSNQEINKRNRVRTEFPEK